MTIELFITIVIATIGWSLAIIQFCYKRKWQKKDLLASRRYDAYSQYLRKCEEINENMRKDPQTICSIAMDFYEKLFKEDNTENMNDILIELKKNVQLYSAIKHSFIYYQSRIKLTPYNRIKRIDRETK